MNKSLIVAAAFLLFAGCSSAPTKEPTVAISGLLDGPEITGQADDGLLQASHMAVQSLGDMSKLAAIASADGIYFYPAFACKSQLLPRDKLSASTITPSFTIDTCHEEDPAKMLTQSWDGLIDGIQQSLALTKTDRISLEERVGIGIDTGTSYRAETEFPADTHSIAAYYYLGTIDQGYRDWEEVGFVFQRKGQQWKLVAIYQDHFSAL